MQPPLPGKEIKPKFRFKKKKNPKNTNTSSSKENGMIMIGLAFLKDLLIK